MINALLETFCLPKCFVDLKRWPCKVSAVLEPARMLFADSLIDVENVQAADGSECDIGLFIDFGDRSWEVNP
jgi:hypothetical protein